MVSKGAYVALSIICALWLVPLLLLLSSSLSNNDVILSEGYSLLPRQFDLTAYKYLLSKSPALLHALWISLVVMAVGTLLSVLICSMLAYPLARRQLSGGRLIMVLILFTMLFNGGLVPTYIIYTQIFHIKDTMFALIVPNLLVSGGNIMLMRTYFRASVADAIVEAAEIDGAGAVTVYFKIVMPLSMPIFATVGLLQATVYWNDWFNALLFIDDTQLLSLQAVMNQMLTNLNSLSSLTQGSINAALGGAQIAPPTATVRMAMAVLGILPTIITFPFAQKYLVRGITLGGIKG